MSRRSWILAAGVVLIAIAGMTAFLMHRRRVRRAEIASCATSRLLPSDPLFAKPAAWMMQHSCYDADVDSAIAAAQAVVHLEEKRAADSLAKISDSAHRADSLWTANAESTLVRLRRRSAQEEERALRQQAKDEARGQRFTDSMTRVLQAERDARP